MLFNSYEFLFAFLPLVLIGYYLVFRGRGRMVFLTVMSYVFYGWWDYRFCALMFISTILDYVAGARVVSARSALKRKAWVGVSLFGNLGLLGFFKYYDLGAGTINQIAAWLGETGPLIPLLRITLPVGISFYTFQSMSYSIDLYRGVARPARGFWDFACYVSLFPQLVAGPIVRYHELADQLVNRTHSVEKAMRGVRFFILGLAKKVILADGVAPLVAAVFDQTREPGFVESWSGVCAYAMQIYFDFSGYSDMAVGLGLLLGFEFPQNFNSPYKAVSITDFWRRWHISLSSWLRDYLYIPLGGNRFGPWRTYFNLFVTMLLGGLWHGANWTFVIWGGYHGLLLAAEKAVGKRSLLWWAPLGIQRAATFILVLLGWVLFRCGSLTRAGRLFVGMVGAAGWTWSNTDLIARPLAWLTLFAAAILAWCFPNTWELLQPREPHTGEAPMAESLGRIWGGGLLRGVGLTALFLICVGVILVNSSSPFLYFQF